MRDIYKFGMALILATGIVALALGGLDNMTGAFSNRVISGRGSFLTSSSLDFQVCYSNTSHAGEGCPLTLYSGTNDIVQETGKNATAANINPAWASIPGAIWIWNTSTVTDPLKNQSFTFIRRFNWNGTDQNSTIEIAADNTYDIHLNGIPVGYSLSGNNYAHTNVFSMRGAVRNGTNVLTITVTNFGGANTPNNNTAGLLYKIVIWKDSCAVLSKSIDGKAIYNFNDVKPGDKGTDVLCLTAIGSDAWSCLNVLNKQDKENGLTDPEIEAGDITGGPYAGELSKYLNFFGWNDTNHDNQYDAGEVGLFSGSFAAGAPVFTIADPTTGPLLDGNVEYLGLYWCLGNITGIANHSLSCDGSSPLNNQAQTDMMTADLAFYAVQSTNNPNFRCGS